MAKFKMKQLALAVGVAAGGMGLVPSAQAVNLATDGLGQALIFPYYTTRAGWNTLINITNTSNQVVVAKVRFHEGYNSRDVFDFNVIMSPFDVWNGTVSNGPGDIPVFSTQDTSCTVPQIPAVGQPFEGNGASGTLAYTGIAADGGPTGTDRMREGYISVVMMGTSPPTGLAANAVHTAAGVPSNCAALRSAFALSGTTTIAGLRDAFPDYAVNPLKGAFSLVNAANGWNAASEAVTLANFFVPPADATAVYQGLNLITAQLPPDRVGNVFTDSFHEPDLSSGNTSGQVLLVDGTVSDSANLTPPVTTGVAAVSFVLNRASVVNQWANLDAAPPARPWDVKSDWVVTFPTKRFHVDTATHEFAGQATGRPGVPAGLAPPFSQVFRAGQSCDDVNYTIYDREEQQIIRQDEPVFSPAPSQPGNQLCEEVNILTFGSGDTVTNVLKSPMGQGTLSGNIAALPGNNGWMQLNFQNTAGLLPVVGFSVINRTEPTGILNESYIVDNAYIR